MELVTVPEAARRLGVTEDTVKRRLRKGELQGERKERSQGYTWMVELPDEEPKFNLGSEQ
jgi:excisionase family DNA binding protein